MLTMKLKTKNILLYSLDQCSHHTTDRSIIKSPTVMTTLLGKSFPYKNEMG